MSKAAHTPPPIFAVNYAGHISMQLGPYYGDQDILDANNVGEDIAEANGELLRIAYNHHQELVTRLQSLVREFSKPDWDIVCDHSVGICACDVIRLLEDAEETLNKVTPK